LSFYRDEIDEERFSIEYAQNLQFLMANAQEEHFWVALFDLGQFYNSSPEMIFTEQDYRVGEVIEVKNNDKRFVLIQLWSK
jgi:hypothetical protein